MSKSLMFIKYFFLLFSLIGLGITLSSTFGSNNYTIQQKLIMTVIFFTFFTAGPFLMYKLFSFVLKR